MGWGDISRGRLAHPLHQFLLKLHLVEGGDDVVVGAIGASHEQLLVVSQQARGVLRVHALRWR